MVFFCASSAQALLCNPAHELCGFVKGQRTSGTPAKPSQSNSIRINPSAVPTEKAIGIEGIYYKGEVDVALARGNGRVGAAISPSNSEETFFGPPGFESDVDLLERKQMAQKYPNQKTTLATAINLINVKGSGLKKFSLNIGVMGKYHKPNSLVTGGAGITATLGPLSLGYSAYRDQAHYDGIDFGVPDEWIHEDYNVNTVSGGLFLGSIAIDYSLLQVIVPNDVYQVRLLTGSLFLKRGIFTVATRSEDSARSAYSYALNNLTTTRLKNETFLGAKLTAGSHFMIGIFYNYYLLRELSLSATLFF